MQTVFINMLSFLFLMGAGCQNDPGSRQPTFKYDPNTIPQKDEFVKVSPDGYFLSAKINGKEWIAREMKKNRNTSDVRIEGKNGGTSIRFGFWLPGKKSGSVVSFNSYNIAYLKISDNTDIWGGSLGGIVIEKIDEFFITGSFYFTGTSPASEEKIEVTSGYFRLPLEPFRY